MINHQRLVVAMNLNTATVGVKHWGSRNDKSRLWPRCLMSLLATKIHVAIQALNGCQSINQSTCQSVNLSIHQSINLSINQSINQLGPHPQSQRRHKWSFVKRFLVSMQA
jgi:hypothetical protein